MVRMVTDYLDLTAKKYPDKIAFSDGNTSTNFYTLRENALHIASSIINLQLINKPIAVFLDKSVECIEAFLGVNYSGNFYSPLDTKMPIERLNKICNVLNPCCILTDNEHAEIIKTFCSTKIILTYETCINTVVDYNLIKNVVDKAIDTDISYVLFTSGSTGIPKGVIISHKSLIAYTEWVSESFDINEQTILGNQTPFYFSMSVLDIYQTIKNAATMFIIPKILFSFPIKLLDFIIEKRINFIYWVPSALCLVANLKALNKRDISCLRQVLFAGEVMPARQLNMWREALPKASFANLFGPTETTDICNFYRIGRVLADDESVPIGDACKNTKLLILDENNKEVTDGAVGELCVKGSILAYGYYKDPQKTKAAFVQNPLNDVYPEFIYRTGDLVHRNEFKELIYDGRKDFQIKHMGHRIELGEIEIAAYSLEQVDQCCCLYDVVKQKIVLFYSGKITEKEILLMLKSKVNEYMIPNKILRLVALPINLNGKIDRVKLKELL